MKTKYFFLLLLLILLYNSYSFATPDFVEHNPSGNVYSQPGVTMRTIPVPRDGDTVSIWTRIGYSFYYTDAVIYYTTDGSNPSGAKGIGSGTTQVLTMTFQFNEPNAPNNIDWWKVTLPAVARSAGVTVKYNIGAWHVFSVQN